jgi:hypothetical protein
MARLYGRTGRLTVQSGGFWPGQRATTSARSSPRRGRASGTTARAPTSSGGGMPYAPSREGVECQVSKSANGDACLRPTKGGRPTRTSCRTRGQRTARRCFLGGAPRWRPSTPPPSASARSSVLSLCLPSVSVFSSLSLLSLFALRSLALSRSLSAGNRAGPGQVCLRSIARWLGEDEDAAVRPPARPPARPPRSRVVTGSSRNLDKLCCRVF